jgi:hypothetical protein
MTHPSLWRAVASFSSSSWPSHILTICHLSNLCIFPLFYCILGVLLQHMKEFCLSSSQALFLALLFSTTLQSHVLFMVKKTWALLAAILLSWRSEMNWSVFCHK